MRMEDLSIRDISYIEDQAVAFYNRWVINLLQMRTIGPLGQTAAAPNPDDGDNDDGTNRQSHRSFNGGGHGPPPPRHLPPPQNLGGHGPPPPF